MRFRILFSVFMIAVFYCGAASAFKTKIYRTNKKRTKIKVSSRGFRSLKSKVVQAENGCEFKVLRVKKKSTLLGVRSCPSGIRLRKGMILNVEVLDDEDFDMEDSGGSRSERKRGGDIYSGMRVSVMKALSTTFTVKSDVALPIYGSSAGQTIGVKVHYAAIPQAGMGYDVAGLINMYNNGVGSAMHFRIDANGTYSIMRNLYLFPGINLNKPFSGEGSSAFSIGFGFQVGVGYKFGEKMGVDFAIVNSSNKATTTNDESISMSISTMEIGFNYQF